MTVGAYEETAKSIGSADSDVVKREANRKAFGAEYALKTYNKDVGEKAAEYVAQGVTYDQYYAAYFAARGITGDKDENGKTITNSASRKKKEAIDKAVPGASTKQKHLCTRHSECQRRCGKEIPPPITEGVFYWATHTKNTEDKRQRCVKVMY